MVSRVSSPPGGFPQHFYIYSPRGRKGEKLAAAGKGEIQQMKTMLQKPDTLPCGLYIFSWRIMKR
jgi:hypothetical protein